MDHLRSGVRDQPGQHDEIPSLKKKNTKISQAWWHTSMVSATWEAVVGESPEPNEVEVSVSHDHATELQFG